MKVLNPVTISPSALKPGNLLGYKIIAVIGYAGDWAAYVGPTDWDDEQVADEGSKISRRAAEALFYAPVAAGLIYRP